MFQTYYNSAFDFKITDSTVYVNPGVARIGNTILPYRGSSIPFLKMVSFGDSTNKYQYSALVLQNFNSVADLTSVPSLLSDSTNSMMYPELYSDSSNPYSPVYPIGLFLFHTDDSTTITLLKTNRIDG